MGAGCVRNLKRAYVFVAAYHLEMILFIRDSSGSLNFFSFFSFFSFLFFFEIFLHASHRAHSTNPTSVLAILKGRNILFIFSFRSSQTIPLINADNRNERRKGERGREKIYKLKIKNHFGESGYSRLTDDCAYTRCRLYYVLLLHTITISTTTTLHTNSIFIVPLIKKDINKSF